MFLPLRGGFSGSGSETDLQEPVPTVFFDKSAKSGNPGGARASLASAGVSRAARNPCPVVVGGKPAHATAGESDRNLGSSHDVVTCFSSINSYGESSRARMSYLDAVLSAPARAPAASLVARCSAPSSAAVGVCMHDDGSSVHGARNSGGTGGLLPVQRSTSYCLGNSWSDTGRVQGPTGTRRVKGGVSGPAEDLRPVSEVEAGVNFRPAGGVRGQVAGSLPRKQPGTGTRQVKGSVVTPSLHPEVPGIQFVSPGYGLDIRQSMGWTKVCGTARSGIWVLKGNDRILRILSPSGRMDLSGNIRDCLGYAGARLYVSIQVCTWSSSQTTN